MNQTEDRIQIVDEKEVSLLISDQINALHDLAGKLNHSSAKARNAVKQADEAKQKSTTLGNRKEAIESLQVAMADLAEAMPAFSDSQKCTFEYLQQMSNIIRYLFQLGLTDISMNRSVIHQLEEMMTGASRQKIDDAVQQEINSVIIQLKARQDMMQQQSDLNVKMKKLNIARKNLEASINSVDNFNMLITEIDQGVYTGSNALVSICNVLSQLDRRILCAPRKLEIIRRSLEEQNILNDTKIPLREYLTGILCVPAEDMGEILELGTIRDNCVADTTLSVVDSYFSMEITEREAKSVPVWISDVIKEKGLSDTISFSTNEIYNDFISGKIHVMEELSANDESAHSQSWNDESLKATEEDSFQDDSRNQEEREAEKLEEARKLQEAEQLYYDCKLDEAFEMFYSLAEKGNGRAMYFLGEYYDHQYGHVAKDSKESRKWRMKGYEAGDPLAALNACRYLEDDSAERKQVLENVFPVIKSMAESGDVYAQYELAGMYFLGYGVKENKKQGMRWQRKSAEAGFWHAITEMGDIYCNGTYMVQDYSRALNWYVKGIEKGDAYSYLGMAYCYVIGKVSDEKFEKAYQTLTNSFMVNILANGYSRWIAYGIQKEKWKKNIKMILQLLTESYDRGCGQAAWMISLMYGEGVFGSADSEQEFLWAGRSAELGTEEGLTQLGDCYYFGRGTKQNTDLARKYYKLASDEGSNEANIRLGLLAFDNKKDTESLSPVSLPPWMLHKNYTESSKWFELAKKQGSVITDAVEIICEIFKNGQKESIYRVSDSLKKTLSIKEDEKVYLAHDDTWLKTGKNGFAITEKGIYCRGLGVLTEAPLHYTSFRSLALCEQIHYGDEDCYIYADECLLAYITGDEKKDVLSLFEKIKYVASVYLQ